MLTSSRAVYGEGPWRAADGSVFEPAPRSHAQLAAAQWAHVDASGQPAIPLPADAATTHPNPSSVYGSTKLAQELVLRNWSASFSVPLSVFRLQNVYGPGQSPHNPYTGIITLFHRLASRGETLDVYEDGEINRDFVYIDDVVAALVAGIDEPPAEQRILDVGNGVAHHDPRRGPDDRRPPRRPRAADLRQVPRWRRALGLGRRHQPPARRSAGRRHGRSRTAARRSPTG